MRPFKAVNVGLVCAYYDMEGRFMGLHRTLIPSINASSSVLFELYLESVDGVGHVDLMAFAGDYEESFIGNYLLFAILVILFSVFVIFMKRRGW